MRKISNIVLQNEKRWKISSGNQSEKRDQTYILYMLTNLVEYLNLYEDTDSLIFQVKVTFPFA